MINEIKRELERKEKVYIELVDPNGLRDRGDLHESLIQDLLDSDKLQVLDAGLGIHDNLVKVRLHNSCRAILIDKENLVFFEMVSEGATFDDLIDIAVQAVKDGVAEINRFEINNIDVVDAEDNTIESTAFRYSEAKIRECIEFIKSLYIEAFTIESLADIEKIKLGAKLSQNGFEYEVNQSRLNSLLDAKLFLLKGATVTQKKTNN